MSLHRHAIWIFSLTSHLICRLSDIPRHNCSYRIKSDEKFNFMEKTLLFAWFYPSTTPRPWDALIIWDIQGLAKGQCCHRPQTVTWGLGPGWLWAWRWWWWTLHSCPHQPPAWWHCLTMSSNRRQWRSWSASPWLWRVAPWAVESVTQSHSTFSVLSNPEARGVILTLT